MGNERGRGAEGMNLIKVGVLSPEVLCYPCMQSAGRGLLALCSWRSKDEEHHPSSSMFQIPCLPFSLLREPLSGLGQYPWALAA